MFEHWTFIDFIIVLCIAWGVIVGYQKGLVRQLSSIIALVVGIIATRLLGDVAADILFAISPSLAEKPFGLGQLISHVILFSLIYLTIRLVGIELHSVTHNLHLGVADHTLGAIFCTLKYLFILSVVLSGWLAIFSTSTLIEDSHFNFLSGFVVNIAPFVFDLIHIIH